LVEFAPAAETALCLAIEDSNSGAKSAEAAGCTVLVVPNQVPVLGGPRRVFVDGPERTIIREPSVSSLYNAIPFHQDASVLIIGERRTPTAPRHFVKHCSERLA